MSEHELWNELGNLYFISGAYNQAINAYHRSIEMDASFGRPYSNLALTFVQQGKYEEAIELYRRSIELLADNKEKAISWNKLGNVHRFLKNYQKAVVAYQLADELDPESIESREEPGTLLSAPAQDPSIKKEIMIIEPDERLQGDQERVLAADQQIELDPPKTEAILIEDTPDAAPIQMEASLPSPLESRPVWAETSSASNPTCYPTLEQGREELIQEPILMGLAQTSPEEEDVASEFAGESAGWESEDPQDLDDFSSELQYPLAPGLQEMDNQLQWLDALSGPVEGEFEMVAAGLDPMTFEGESEPMDQLMIGTDEQVEVFDPSLSESRQQETKDIEIEIARFKRVVRINTRNAFAWDTLGTLYKSANLYKDAILAYQQAISINSTKAFYYYHLGLAYAADGRDEDAIAAFQRVIELDPDYSLAHATLGGYYRKMGLEELAQQHLGKAMKNIFDSENEYNRACLEAICGNADQAIELLRVALLNKQTYVDWVLRDPDLDFIRQDSRFKQLISEFTL